MDFVNGDAGEETSDFGKSFEAKITLYPRGYGQMARFFSVGIRFIISVILFNTAKIFSV